MPYTPSGGYYERKPKTRNILASAATNFIRRAESPAVARLRRKGIKPAAAQRLGARLGPAVKHGRYSVLVCFDTEAQAHTFHRHITEYAKQIQSDGRMIHLGLEVSNDLRYVKSIALHDCVKHPLNFTK